MKKFKTSLDCFNLEPLHLNAYFQLASVFINMKRVKKAIKIYDKIIQIINSRPGILFKKQEKLNQALESFKQICNFESK